MMSQAMRQMYPEVDWSLYDKQNNAPSSPQSSQQPQQEDKDVWFGNPKMTDTFLGSFSNDSIKNAIAQAKNPESYKEAMDLGVGGGGIEMAAKGAAPLVKSGINYLKPEQKAKELLSSFGQGTSKETTEELSKRLQFGKKSATEEALIPKRELYSQVGGEDIYKIPESKLPEGNIEQFSQMFEPGSNFSEKQTKALSKALKDYRSGNMTKQMKEIGGSPQDIFLHRAGDILNIPELEDKAEGQIEDILSMPTKRNSEYFSDENVSAPYSKKGNLMQLHNQYSDNPTLNNYDSLQSAIKKELRKQIKLSESGSDVASAKRDQLELNAANLDKDQKSFSNELPDKLKDLDLQWRTKYATSVPKYEEAGQTIKKLSEGNWQEVDPNKIVKAFTYDNKKTRDVLQDIGPSAGKNILYLALQKVGTEDAEAFGKKILELKQTKGFDKFIDKDMENKANQLISQSKTADFIKRALKGTGGAALGGLVGGPIGATVGAVLPFGKEAIQLALKRYKK